MRGRRVRELAAEVLAKALGQTQTQAEARAQGLARARARALRPVTQAKRLGGKEALARAKEALARAKARRPPLTVTYSEVLTDSELMDIIYSIEPESRNQLASRLWWQGHDYWWLL